MILYKDEEEERKFAFETNVTYECIDFFMLPLLYTSTYTKSGHICHFILHNLNGGIVTLKCLRLGERKIENSYHLSLQLRTDVQVDMSKRT